MAADVSSRLIPSDDAIGATVLIAEAIPCMVWLWFETVGSVYR